jgi:hypothetical protein
MSDISIRYQTGAPQNLEKRFATRAAGMLPSEIRSLFAVASRPEIVSLAGGMPNLSALPMEMMDKVIQSFVNRSAM